MTDRETRRWQYFESERALQKVRKQNKRKQNPKKVRRRDWTLVSFEDLEALDDCEQVMPRGEQERRRANLAKVSMTIEADQPDDLYHQNASTVSSVDRPGVVVEVSSHVCRVELGDRNLMCSLRRSLVAEQSGFTNAVAVGDEVIVSEHGAADQGVVEAVLPRRSILARPDVFHSHLRQVIVANASQLLIVASWRDPAIWPELIDRYLITAERHNLSAILCVNKIDLADDRAACYTTVQPYLDLGYRVIHASAFTGEGVGQLCELLRGQMTVLAGLSGVGKSSLLVAIQPDLALRTGQVSEHSGQGRHTTSQASMLRLEMGGFVVDTPGIREFGLSGLQPAEVLDFYPDIAAVASGCQFKNCSHIHEPGCAVQVAVRQGGVSAMRYHSFRNILPGTLKLLRMECSC